jgi:dynein heavy chain
VVKFSDEFKVLIKEAKQLEKMGYKISKAIINISLQEKEYYRYIDRMHIMLREYNESVHSLTEIEKKLLEDPIRRLNRALEPGHESLNLSSLGIPDFIENCMRSINEFRDLKKKVAKSAGMIEDIVKSIEDSVILREYDFE